MSAASTDLARHPLGDVTVDCGKATWIRKEAARQFSIHYDGHLSQTVALNVRPTDSLQRSFDASETRRRWKISMALTMNSGHRLELIELR